MRKFCSLFATLALITSATSTSVVACGSKTNNDPKPPTSPTQNIVSKIDNKTVTLDDNDKTQPGTFD